MVIKVNVKFLGAFRGISGKSQSNVVLNDRTNIKALIQKLAETFPSDFKRVLIDPELDDPRPNALILVNGKEVSALEGIATKINDGDEVVLISVSHGG